jgi:hypothetical protein
VTGVSGSASATSAVRLLLWCLQAPGFWRALVRVGLGRRALASALRTIAAMRSCARNIEMVDAAEAGVCWPGLGGTARLAPRRAGRSLVRPLSTGCR